MATAPGETATTATAIELRVSVEGQFGPSVGRAATTATTSDARVLPAFLGADSMAAADVTADAHYANSASRKALGAEGIELADYYSQVVKRKLVQSMTVELRISGLPKRRRAKPNLVNREPSEDLVNRALARNGPTSLG